MKNILLILYFGIVPLMNCILLMPWILVSEYTKSSYINLYINSFVSGLVFVLKFFYGCKIMISGLDNFKLRDHNVRTLLLSNHLSEFDYMFLYNIVGNSNIYNILKNRIRMIMTKVIYTMLAGIGMANMFGRSICVNWTNKEKTKTNMENMRIFPNDVLILFCEGDNQNKESMTKSKLFATNNPNQIQMTNVMFPRTVGVEILNKNNDFDQIIYTTIYYDDQNYRPPIENRIKLLTDDVPKKIFIKFQTQNVKQTEQTEPIPKIDSSEIINIYKTIDNNLEEMKNHECKDDFSHSKITPTEIIGFVSNIILAGLSMYLLYAYPIMILYNILVLVGYYIYVCLAL